MSVFPAKHMYLPPLAESTLPSKQWAVSPKVMDKLLEGIP